MLKTTDPIFAEFTKSDPLITRVLTGCGGIKAFVQSHEEFSWKNRTIRLHHNNDLEMIKRAKPTKAEIKEATALLTDLIAQKGVDGTISCGSGHYIDLHNTSPLFRFVVSACGGIEKFVMSRRGVFEGCSPLGEIVLVGSINSVKNRIRSKNAKEWQEAVALREKAKALKDEAVALLVDAIKRYGLNGSLSVRSKSYSRLHSPTMSNQTFKAAVKKCGGIKQLCESHKDLLEHSKGVITFVGEWDDSIKTTASLARPPPPRTAAQPQPQPGPLLKPAQPPPTHESSRKRSVASSHERTDDGWARMGITDQEGVTMSHDHSCPPLLLLQRKIVVCWQENG
jgi:hypothetical protein